MASKKILALVAVLFLISVPAAFTQEIDYCEGDFDCDGDVDGTNAAQFKQDFGRRENINPCPSCVPVAPAAKTGQTSCYDELGNVIDCAGTGQDGEYQVGYERFTDNGDGTVTDNFTGLIWLKDANCIKTHYPSFDQDSLAGDGRVTWQHALNFIKGINDGTFPLCSGDHTDWRLPNEYELFSCVGNSARLNNPFINQQRDNYWSSTSNPFEPVYALSVGWGSGGMTEYTHKSSDYVVLPVRGGL